LAWPEEFPVRRELFDQKRAAVFQHVYVSYPEREASVHARAGWRVASQFE
jgi:hypothetical protein